VFPKTSRLAPGSSSIIPHFSSPLFPLWIGRSFFSFQHANKHHCTSSISHEFLYTETPFFPRDAGLTFFLTTLIHFSFFFFFQHVYSLSFVLLLVWFGLVVVYFWLFGTLIYFPSLRSFLHILCCFFFILFLLKKNYPKWSFTPYRSLTHLPPQQKQKKTRRSLV